MFATDCTFIPNRKAKQVALDWSQRPPLWNSSDWYNSSLVVAQYTFTFSEDQLDGIIQILIENELIEFAAGFPRANISARLAVSSWASFPAIPQTLADRWEWRLETNVGSTTPLNRSFNGDGLGLRDMCPWHSELKSLRSATVIESTWRMRRLPLCGLHLRVQYSLVVTFHSDQEQAVMGSVWLCLLFDW